MSDSYGPMVAARFWSKVAVRRSRTCWEWTGSKDKNGYGQFKPVSGPPQRAHRIAFELINQMKVAEEAHVLHECDNPSCCNPNHLKIGDAAVNARDRTERGRGRNGFSDRKERHERRRKWAEARSRKVGPGIGTESSETECK